MNKAITATLWVVRITGIVQVVLGLLFWSGHQLSLTPVHMAIGLALITNMLFKFGLVVVIGGKPLARQCLPGMAAIVVGMIAGLLLVCCLIRPHKKARECGLFHDARRPSRACCRRCGSAGLPVH